MQVIIQGGAVAVRETADVMAATHPARPRARHHYLATWSGVKCCVDESGACLLAKMSDVGAKRVSMAAPSY